MCFTWIFEVNNFKGYYYCWKYQTAGDGPDVVQSDSLPAHCLLSWQVGWIFKKWLGRYEINLNIWVWKREEKVSDAILHPRQKAETADVRRSRRYWFAFRILVIQSLTHSGAPATNFNFLCKFLAARAENILDFCEGQMHEQPWSHHPMDTFHTQLLSQRICQNIS